MSVFSNATITNGTFSNNDAFGGGGGGGCGGASSLDGGDGGDGGSAVGGGIASIGAGSLATLVGVPPIPANLLPAIAQLTVTGTVTISNNVLFGGGGGAGGSSYYGGDGGDGGDAYGGGLAVVDAQDFIVAPNTLAATVNSQVTIASNLAVGGGGGGSGRGQSPQRFQRQRRRWRPCLRRRRRGLDPQLGR